MLKNVLSYVVVRIVYKGSGLIPKVTRYFAIEYCGFFRVSLSKFGGISERCCVISRKIDIIFKHIALYRKSLE